MKHDWNRVLLAVALVVVQHAGAQAGGAAPSAAPLPGKALIPGIPFVSWSGAAQVK